MKAALLALLGSVVVAPVPSQAYVSLMAGQSARPLGGSFNNVPVLHSNQPEEVLGPGILMDTRPGSAIAAETNQPSTPSTVNSACTSTTSTTRKTAVASVGRMAGVVSSPSPRS
jgi:hypothetical protein